VDAGVWGNTLLWGTVGVLTAFVFGLFAVTFNVTGHGSSLVAYMFGVGLLAIPVVFAAAAAPRRYLTAALCGALLVVVMHWFVAASVYRTNDLERGRFEQMGRRAKNRARLFGVVVVLAEVVPVCIVVGRLRLRP
jgi:hypothetical protein